MFRFAVSGFLLLTGCAAAQGSASGESGAGGQSPATGGANAVGGANTGGGRATGGASNSGGTSATGGTANSGGTSTTGGNSSSGGSSNTGGSSTGGAPVVVHPCGDLPAAGTWENISPPEFVNPSNMETLAVVVDQSDQSVYAAAGNKTNGGNGSTGILKSTDCGATWAVVSTGANKDKLMSGDPWGMLIDGQEPSTLYVNNGYGNDPTIYKSTNGGVDWTALSPDPVKKTQSFVQDIAMEPGNSKHLAVTFHDNCSAPLTPLCISQSSDGGATWHEFNGPSQLGGWQEGASLSVIGPTSYLYLAGGAWFTSDGGGSWSKAINDGFLGAYGGSTDLGPDGTLYATGAGSVYKSNSNPLGSAWTQIAGSPRGSCVIDDGVSLFVSNAWGNPQPNWSAPLSNLTSWTHMPSPSMSRGSNQLAYDETHHIVYSANWGAGLWRVVTR